MNNPRAIAGLAIWAPGIIQGSNLIFMKSAADWIANPFAGDLTATNLKGVA